MGMGFMLIVNDWHLLLESFFSCFHLVLRDLPQETVPPCFDGIEYAFNRPEWDPAAETKRRRAKRMKEPMEAKTRIGMISAGSMAKVRL